MQARLTRGLLGTWSWAMLSGNGDLVASSALGFGSREACLAHLSGASAVTGLVFESLVDASADHPSQVISSPGS